MDQYNMILPDDKKIYFETNPKAVALKVFRKLNKNKINQSRIIFENNTTKKKHEYIAMTNNKLNDYKKLNSIQFGGSNLSNDKEFLNQLKKISSDLELTFSEFKKIIDSKIKTETNDDIFIKVVDQLDKLDNKVEILSKQFNITPTNKNTSESISDSINKINNNVDKIINKQKTKNKSDSISDSIDNIKNNVQHLVDTQNNPSKKNNSNYCVIS
tara:strand:+ start:127 stop:768 length:642 start_codon:yes stop_codon:yes gene_type:complete